MDGEPLLYYDSPWLRSEFVTLAAFWLPYVSADRFIPWGVGESSLGSYKWRRHVDIP